MTRSTLLTIDSGINLALGAFLVSFPRPLVSLLGIPASDTAFYPSILGAVLIGIGIALWLERGNVGGAARGLGLMGAIAINLSGGGTVALWLIFGRLSLSMGGKILLWALVMVLVGVSLAELLASRGE